MPFFAEIFLPAAPRGCAAALLICAGARGARSIKFGAPRGNGKERARPFGRTGFSSYIMRAHDFLLYGRACARLIEKTHASPSSRAAGAAPPVIRKKPAFPSSGRNALPHRHPEEMRSPTVIRKKCAVFACLQGQKRAFRFGRARFAKRKAQTHPRRVHSAREPENGAAQNAAQPKDLRPAAPPPATRQKGPPLREAPSALSVGYRNGVCGTKTGVRFFPPPFSGRSPSPLCPHSTTCFAPLSNRINLC